MVEQASTLKLLMSIPASLLTMAFIILMAPLIPLFESVLDLPMMDWALVIKFLKSVVISISPTHLGLFGTAGTRVHRLGGAWRLYSYASLKSISNSGRNAY